MRRTALYVAAWFAAGVLAVTLASVGVSMVSDQVTGDRPAPLTAAQVSDELAGTNGATTDPTTTVAVDETTTTAAAATDDEAPGEVSRPPATTPSGESGSGSGSGSSGSGSSAGSSPPTTVTTAPAPAPAVTRTYPMVGGTVTLRFTTRGVSVLAASPSAGFSVKISDAHDTGARVEFKSEDHESRVDGWWDGGPKDEVREESDGS